ncbi:MAG: hypothetical protein ACRDNR_00415 [Gaiellaceae bacterium]
MEAQSAAEERGSRPEARWRLWALVPIVLLVAVVSLFSARGGSLLELVGENPPPADEFDVRRVEFSPGESSTRRMSTSSAGGGLSPTSSRSEPPRAEKIETTATRRRIGTSAHRRPRPGSPRRSSPSATERASIRP